MSVTFKIDTDMIEGKKIKEKGENVEFLNSKFLKKRRKWVSLSKERNEYKKIQKEH